MRIRGGVSTGILFTLGALGFVTGALLPNRKPATKPKVNFSRDVLPILSDKCFKCHGPDSASRMADLRLDRPEGAFADRGGTYAIVPGRPDHSVAFRRMARHEMPPPDSDKSLSKREIEILTQWIAEGAEYEKLWSFKPIPSAVSVPKVPGKWATSDIDRFIQARLIKEHLSPSAPASRLRWLRRVTYDLTGLPPTEVEISNFQSAKSPRAYEDVVDRLLSSPHYGERIAVDWLDAARYSDSYGYQSDLLSPTWPYRDWVVKAFNQNLPYDKFLTYQLAGDLLPNPTREQRLATAFNRLHRQSNEGGSIALEYRTEYASDRVNTYGTSILGLTVGCAKCHDHKFDPITQKEYYQLFGYFNSIDEYGLLLSTEIVPTPSMLLPNPEQENRLAELHREDEQARRKIFPVMGVSDAPLAKWLKEKPAKLDIPDVVARFDLDQYTDKFVNQVPGPAYGTALGSVNLAPGHQGKAPAFDGENGIAIKGLPGRERWDAFSWSFWIKDPRQKGPVVLLHRTGGTDVGFCGFELMLEDGYLTASVMRSKPGNALTAKTLTRIPKNTWTQIGWTYDGCGRASGLRLFVNGRPAQDTHLNDSLWKTINAYADLGPSGGDWAFGQRFRDAGFKGGMVDDLTYATRDLSPPEMAQLARIRPDQDTWREYYLSALDPEFRAAKNGIRETQKALAEFENGIDEISVMKASRQEIPPYVLARGNYDAPRTDKNRVRRDVPKSLPPLKANRPNDRLALAEWTTRPDNPLTARVAVNRLWQLVFGVGLVETSENFGVQGARPTHPELLDYLSRKFIKSGWNVKALLKDMVLSATYRQDSVRTARLSKVDPENRLLARGPSHRLSAEMVRDTALAASGLLNDKIGGAPVNPYQPAGIWQEYNTMSPGFVQSTGADLYRRSLYSTWKRTTPVPSMMMFDATSREACTIRRPTTNTPLQALVLLNDVQFVEAARVLAQKVQVLPGTTADHIRTAFRRLAGRDPDARERAILLETYKGQLAQFRADKTLAEGLMKVGQAPVSPSLDINEVAALTVTSQTVLNSDAVVWRR